MTTRSNLLWIILLLSVHFGSAHAADCAKPGTTLKATNTVVVRDAPPQEKFLFVVGSPGNKLGELKSDALVTVNDCAIISAPFRKDVWIKATATDGTSGWMYSGSTSKLTNFKFKPAE